MGLYLRHLFLFFMAVTAVTGCSGTKDEVVKPVILDENRILSDATKKWLETAEYPKGFAFIFRAVKILDPKEVGVRADEFFELDSERSVKPDICRKRGVYLLISNDPLLIQIRVGTEIYIQCLRAGIIAGPEYINYQSVTEVTGLDGSVVKTVTWLITSLPKAIETEWYRRYLLAFFRFFYPEMLCEIQETNLPSDSFYGHYLLEPFLRIRLLELNYLNSWWISFVVGGAAILLARLIMTSAFIGLLVRWASPKIANTIGMVINISVGIALSIPSVMSMVLLSGGRMEDRMALRASGLPGIAELSFRPELYMIQTTFLFAILVFLLRILKGVADMFPSIPIALASEAVQQKTLHEMEENNPLGAEFIRYMGTEHWLANTILDGMFESSPYTVAMCVVFWEHVKKATGWALASWLLLPKVAVLAAIFLWLPPIFAVIARSVFLVDKLYNENRPSNKRWPFVLTKLGIALGIGMALFFVYRNSIKYKPADPGIDSRSSHNIVKTAVVNVKIANVRARPSIESQILFRLNPTTIVNYISLLT